MRFSRSLFVALVCLPAAAQPIPGRYIVELAEPPAGVLQADMAKRQPGRRAAQLAASADVVARRAAVQAGQQRVARAIVARGGRVLDGVDTVLNALFVKIGEQGAEELRRMPGVARVSPDRRYRAKLDRVLTLSKVPEAWEKIGGPSQAGAGTGIAILDSGIDTSHPGFQDDTLVPPQGFPVASSRANRDYLTRKVVVVRSYEDLAEDDSYGEDAADRNGHGTNAACAAACVAHRTNLGVIAGVAPRAFLGAYKVLGDEGGGSDAMILKGIDDAVKDGMDVLNLSLGSDIPSDPAQDAQVRALNLAAEAGYIIAVAAGNAGPDENTINSPGTADQAITVGSSSSDREITENGPKPIDPNRLSEFSSRGPNPGPAMKPDMVAVGDNFFTAASTEIEPEIFYTVTQGTSFATPAVAGGAAVVKGARPGFSSAVYRSLLINSSSEIRGTDGKIAPVRHQGAGRMDLLAALDMPVAFAPSSVKFGVGGASAQIAREITVGNLTSDTVTLELSVRSFDDKPPAQIQGPATITIPGRSTATIALRFEGSGLSGEYQGVLLARNNRNNVVARVPYWYGVRSNTARAVTLLEFKGGGTAGQETLLGARVVDASGIDVADARLSVATSTPGARVAKVEAAGDAPGVFGVVVVLAKGDNVFEFSSGGVTRRVAMVGE